MSNGHNRKIRKTYGISYQLEHYQDNQAEKILYGGFSVQQLPQTWGTTSRQEICMPRNINKHKVYPVSKIRKEITAFKYIIAEHWLG